MMRREAGPAVEFQVLELGYDPRMFRDHDLLVQKQEKIDKDRPLGCLEEPVAVFFYALFDLLDFPDVSSLFS